MKQKIMISESQLAKLMENKAKQLNEEEAMNEIGLGVMEWGLARMVAPIVIEKMKESGHDMSVLHVGIFTRALEHELNNLMKGEHQHEEPSSDEMDLETGGGETMETADDLGFPKNEMEGNEMMNESVKEYKSEFNRFMKGPKI